MDCDSKPSVQHWLSSLPDEPKEVMSNKCIYLEENQDETKKYEPDYITHESDDVVVDELDVKHKIKEETSEFTCLSKPDQKQEIEIRIKNQGTRGQDPETGHIMSLSQLCQLWHFDMHMAHILLDLPLRKCSAIPGDDSNFPPMDSASLRALKSRIGKMWITASHLFECRKTGDRGWGLFVSKDYNKNERILTVGKPVPLGWVAKAPGQNDATFHRYLRSPCIRGADSSLYLGGPISLANYDCTDMLTCKISISREKHLANTMLVSRAAKRKFNPGDEVMWTYNITAKNSKLEGDFYRASEWKLKCCSESDVSLAKSIQRRSYQGKKSVGVKSFRPCTYCGKNLAEASKPGSKINIKCHLALKHAVDLCGELGYPSEDVMSAKSFIQHLDLVVNVYNVLNNMNYKVVPSCQFFEITGTPMLNPDATQEERDQVFHAFEEAGKKAFKMFQVLFLKGITKPTRYEDLLVSANSKYSDIRWSGDRPSTTTFSLSPYSFTKEEENAHALEIKSSAMKAVLMWMND